MFYYLIRWLFIWITKPRKFYYLISWLFTWIIKPRMFHYLISWQPFLWTSFQQAFNQILKQINYWNNSTEFGIDINKLKLIIHSDYFHFPSAICPTSPPWFNQVLLIFSWKVVKLIIKYYCSQIKVNQVIKTEHQSQGNGKVWSPL